MSVIRCHHCRARIDTDADLDCYIGDTPVCAACREDIEDELEHAHPWPLTRAALAETEEF